mgnify:CR=1 FL=1
MQFLVLFYLLENYYHSLENYYQQHYHLYLHQEELLENYP